MRVLIADDDVTSRLILKSVATKLGHECLTADDGLNAWEQLSSKSVDVLLTDWLMPGLDGPELCRRIRSAEGSHYTYIVLVTGLDFPEHVLEGMRSGADDYLVKPVNAFALETRLVAAERVTALHRQVAHFQDQLEEANRQLLDLSFTDALTGLGNRRRLDQDLAETQARAMRNNRTYAVVLFDVDYFKLFNDHYGHLLGDDTLQKVGACLRREVRVGERAYRYGGEEFLVLLPDCTVEAARSAADRVRVAVSAIGIVHEARPCGPSIVTVSGGVSYWTPGSILTPTEVLKRADEALFEAKADGRNCISTNTAVLGDHEGHGGDEDTECRTSNF